MYKYNVETFFDFCSGIGGGRLGLEQVGLKCVGYSDTSRLSVKTYNLMFDTENERNFGNLKRINTETLPKFDLLIAGFPCQSFSVIGRQDGFYDVRGQIIFHIARILQQTSPKCFILENVKGLVSHDKGNTLKIILNLLDSSGYDVTYKVLNSIDYGVPQMRQRVYFIGFLKSLKVNISDFKFPVPVQKPSLLTFLKQRKPASEIDIQYFIQYLKNKTNKSKFTFEQILEMEGKVIDTRMSDLRIYDDKVPTLRSHRDGIYYIFDSTLCALTGYEALLLQGFPKEKVDKVKDIVSNRHLLLQAGNAMTVNVIKEIGNTIITFLK